MAKYARRRTQRRHRVRTVRRARGRSAKRGSRKRGVSGGAIFTMGGGPFAL